MYSVAGRFPLWALGGAVGSRPAAPCWALNGNGFQPEVRGLSGVMSTNRCARCRAVHAPSLRTLIMPLLREIV